MHQPIAYRRAHRTSSARARDKELENAAELPLCREHVAWLRRPSLHAHGDGARHGKITTTRNGHIRGARPAARELVGISWAALREGIDRKLSCALPRVRDEAEVARSRT